MELTLSEKMTKKEFLSVLSFIENWCDGLQTNTIISGVKINIETENNHFNTVKESVKNNYNIKNSTNEITQKMEHKDPFIKFEELSKWMFIKEKDFVAPSKIKGNLQYIGITQYPFRDTKSPVYSIEHYCLSKGIEFLKEEDLAYMPKHIAAELIPDSLNNLKVSAIYLEIKTNKLVECFNLKDVEKAFSKPIYKRDEIQFPLVSSSDIGSIVQYLKYNKSIGKLYRAFESIRGLKCLLDVYDIDEIAEKNDFVLFSKDEFEKKRFVQYLTKFDLGAFPEKMNVKEHASVVGCRRDDGREVKPIYKTEQILKRSSRLIPAKEIKKDYFRCPIRYLYFFKVKLRSFKEIEFDKLEPIGFTENTDLIFDNVPPRIKEILEKHIELKETSRELAELKKDRKN